ncbi:MAG: glutamate--cysteine ligase [Hyphomicrobiales bacterium]|nr:glutamate--cysteine ligase [Hyphomicrobiales bacterium]
MARDVTDTTVLSSRRELIEWLEAGNKPQGPHRIGTEHEKIPFYKADQSPVPYKGHAGAGGIEALLQGLRAQSGWSPIVDGPHTIIGLADDHGGGAISLEPGGQFELSGAPLLDVHETMDEFDRHMAAVKTIGDMIGVGFLDLGASPLWTRAQTPVMPKQRYEIMARYMPKVGSRGLDMMFRTATIQTNLDFASEADMVRKMRVSLALQPLATALFANSPFLDGGLNGFLSMRSEIWRHTDGDRTGMMPFMFEPGAGFESYVDFALAAPMYFVKRGEVYHDVAGARFGDLLEGRLAHLPGERATLSDWANHLSTVFPEVRLKRYIEMRGADMGPRSHIGALPALFVGLLYDQDSLQAALDLVAGWSAQERQRLRDETPRLGLAASIGGRTLRDIGRDALAIAERGLSRRARRNGKGQDETIYLDPLRRIVETGQPRAAELIAHFKGDWRDSVLPAFSACAL